MDLFNPLIPANAGTQIVWRLSGRMIPVNAASVELCDLGPGIRRDER